MASVLDRKNQYLVVHLFLQNKTKQQEVSLVPHYLQVRVGSPTFSSSSLPPVSSSDSLNISSLPKWAMLFSSSLPCLAPHLLCLAALTHPKTMEFSRLSRKHCLKVHVPLACELPCGLSVCRHFEHRVGHFSVEWRTSAPSLHRPGCISSFRRAMDRRETTRWKMWITNCRLCESPSCPVAQSLHRGWCLWHHC